MSNVHSLLLLAGCICSAEGSVNGGLCDDSTVSCQCKANVEGPRCDRCKRGYYGLSASNALGCSSELSNTDISLRWINHFFSLILFTIKCGSFVWLKCKNHILMYKQYLLKFFQMYIFYFFVVVVFFWYIFWCAKMICKKSFGKGAADYFSKYTQNYNFML